jgi:SAM-dependent methyltransferase
MKIFQYTVTLLSYLLRSEKRKLIRISYRLKNKIGLEIGGPSKFFDLKSYFPVYVFAKRIDGVNFSTETVWEGTIKEGKSYHYGNEKTGYQYICEASELKNIETESYDFLLSCHSLEHIANPIKALKSWNSVLKPGGKIVLVLPDKNFTFDQRRPYTTFEHLVNDFENNTTEKDTTHFEEVIQLHDIERDDNITSVSELKNRTENNYTNRCLHHHVYNLELLEEVLTYCNFKIIHKQKAAPFHLVIIGEKLPD